MLKKNVKKKEAVDSFSKIKYNNKNCNVGVETILP